MIRTHYNPPRQAEAGRLAAIAAILDALHKEDMMARCFGRPKP